jgi:hypothetical protein
MHKYYLYTTTFHIQPHKPVLPEWRHWKLWACDLFPIYITLLIIVIRGMDNHRATPFEHVFMVCCGFPGRKTCYADCVAVRHCPHMCTIIILAQLYITATLTDHNAGLIIYADVWNSFPLSQFLHFIDLPCNSLPSLEVQQCTRVRTQF